MIPIVSTSSLALARISASPPQRTMEDVSEVAVDDVVAIASDGWSVSVVNDYEWA